MPIENQSPQIPASPQMPATPLPAVVNKEEINANISAHLENKREAFDGMRAYHQSEIEHKKDGITILQTFLAGTVAIYTGLLTTLNNTRADCCWIITLAAILIAISIIVCSSNITTVTNKKITKDNERYAKYAEEYAVERNLIGLEEQLLANNTLSEWERIRRLKVAENAIPPNNRPPVSGYSHTIKILNILNRIVLLTAAAGAIIVAIAAYYPTNKSAEPTHIIIDAVTHTNSNVMPVPAKAKAAS